MEDFKTVKENAWSLPPGTVPMEMELLYVEENKLGTFKYYKDKDTGEYWYSSSVTDAFDGWIKGREKERRQCLKESERRLKKGV